MVKSSEIKGPDLLNELKELIETPKALGEVCSPTSEALDTTVFDFSKLEIPLNICGKACEEFQQKIKQSSSTSGSNDIRYWNELQIMGDNVDHFQQLLCGYKMAFSIVLINEDRRNIPAIAAISGYETIVEATRDNITALMVEKLVRSLCLGVISGGRTLQHVLLHSEHIFFVLILPNTIQRPQFIFQVAIEEKHYTVPIGQVLIDDTVNATLVMTPSDSAHHVSQINQISVTFRRNPNPVPRFAVLDLKPGMVILQKKCDGSKVCMGTTAQLTTLDHVWGRSGWIVKQSKRARRVIFLEFVEDMGPIRQRGRNKV
ncbi:hypothetical protein ACN38_g12038 [Penicillium nordicum]|uniref:Azaphilone pigments biosynthesis cluster protein L N-terminal domain-containing protein n=1 Tax=Penicillium nordicum TaxID=229535 RepID=A0A0M9WA73_9EURO|nr:hypothetical protein ACN38_g12038 [Penicillium nordicum]